MNDIFYISWTAKIMKSFLLVIFYTNQFFSGSIIPGMNPIFSNMFFPTLLDLTEMNILPLSGIGIKIILISWFELITFASLVYGTIQLKFWLFVIWKFCKAHLKSHKPCAFRSECRRGLDSISLMLVDFLFLVASRVIYIFSQKLYILFFQVSY